MPGSAISISYRHVGLVASAVDCAAGSDGAAAARCHAGDCSLRPDENGQWVGRLCESVCDKNDRLIPGSRDMDPVDCACRLARRLWSEPITGMPVFSIATSKGLTCHWFDQRLRSPTAAFDSWPGSLARPVAAALGCRVYGESGPVAACSTGLYALLAAADQIEHGRASMGLAGAVDASLQALLLAGFARLGVLCRERPSAFTPNANGFAPAEGGALFALTDAPEADWRLLAGVRCGDAGHETRCTDPAVLQACLDALWRACPEPEAIITHGTGTRAGDAYEGAGLDGGPWRSAERVCYKPLIGHCLGASGAVELALAMHGPWRRIWKLSLGFGGHIAGVALQRRDR